jgi:hypothetical protein
VFKKYEGISFEEQIKNGKYKNVKIESTGNSLPLPSDSDKKFEALEKQVYAPNEYLEFMSKDDIEEDEFYGFHIEEGI